MAVRLLESARMGRGALAALGRMSLFLVGTLALLPLGIVNPGLTAVGSISPPVTRAVLVGLVVVVLWCLGLLHLMRAMATGRLAVVYGTSRRGRTYLGSWLGVHLLPWRRVECREGMRVALGTPEHDPRTDRNVVVLVRSGRRVLQVWSPRPVTRGSADHLAEWLAGRGFADAIAPAPRIAGIAKRGPHVGKRRAARGTTAAAHRGDALGEARQADTGA